MREKALIRLVKALVKHLETEGFPKEPFILASSPTEEYAFFICLWRNTGDRRAVEINVNE